MILLPLLAIAALVLKVEFTSAHLHVLCSDETEPLKLEVGDSIVIQSPDFPKKYPSKVKCGWKVDPIGTDDMKISCTSFDMEPREGKKKCEDFLKIENEPEPYCGKNGPVDVTVSSKSKQPITIEFVSDKRESKENFKGFNCTVTALFYDEENFDVSFQLKDELYTEDLNNPESVKYTQLKQKYEELVDIALGGKFPKEHFKFELTDFSDDTLGAFSFKVPGGNTKPASVKGKLSRLNREKGIGKKVVTNALDVEEYIKPKSTRLEAVEECVWNWNNKHQPLILNNGNIIRPKKIEQHGEKTNQFSVPAEGEFLIACPGDKNHLEGIAPIHYFDGRNTHYTVLKAKCLWITGKNKRWAVKVKVALSPVPIQKDMKTLKCFQNIKAIFKDSNNKCDHRHEGKQGDLGFEIKDPFKIVENEFIPLISSCYDSKTESTLWTRHTIYGKSISSRFIPSKEDNDLWDFKGKPELSDAYEIKLQREYMIKYKVDLQSSENCICQNWHFYFAKGHLSPRADFVTKAEQDASFHFANVIPQWQKYNQGNWFKIEHNIRKLAEEIAKENNPDYETDLTIISGGSGPLSMETIQKDPATKDPPKEIYLAEDDNNKKLPAPAFTWKIVIHKHTTDRLKDGAVAFVTSNNPDKGKRVVEIEPFKFNCKDLGWLTEQQFEAEEEERGYTYCITVQDLSTVVTYLPLSVDYIETLQPLYFYTDPIILLQ